MGQQQLLLVILVVLIVGISTIIAVNILGIGAENSNIDAVKQDLMKAASHAQELWERPEMMAGANKDFTDTDAITSSDILQRLNIPGQLDDADDPSEINNKNGVYTVNPINATHLQIIGNPENSGIDIIAVVCRDENNNWILNIEEGSANTENCVNDDD